MKKAKKILSLLLCAILLVGATIAGTVAYLTDTDNAVTNTFSVGKVVITLDEAKVDRDGNLQKATVDDDGNATGQFETVTDIEDATRVTANTYHLMPGKEYPKDPTIHVDANSENCYLFVTVVNEIAAIEDPNNTVASQMAVKGWKSVSDVANTFVYVGTTEGATAPLAVSANANIPVFEKIVVDNTENNDTLEPFKDKTITVNAFAVQVDGFESYSAKQIWNDVFAATQTPPDDSNENG